MGFLRTNDEKISNKISKVREVMIREIKTIKDNQYQILSLLHNNDIPVNTKSKGKVKDGRTISNSLDNLLLQMKSHFDTIKTNQKRIQRLILNKPVSKSTNKMGTAIILGPASSMYNRNHPRRSPRIEALSKRRTSSRAV